MNFMDEYALIISAGGDAPITVDDAKGVAEILQDPQQCVYPPKQVRLLTGKGATR